jgi:hypothetical protein
MQRLGWALQDWRSLPRTCVLMPPIKPLPLFCRVLVLLLLLLAQPSEVRAEGGPLELRLERWPSWSLPAPLPRPGRSDLIYPEWFVGTWQATSTDLNNADAVLTFAVRFEANRRGQVVGDRAFNAAAVGHALLGNQLMEVRDDPNNPNRQLAVLQHDQQLESTVVGRRTEHPTAEQFLADELTLQVLHGLGEPRISRVETLSRYQRISTDRIEAQQWQASYGSPADGLSGPSLRSWRGALVLERNSPQERPT